jgi:hypothetical protein
LSKPFSYYVKWVNIVAFVFLVLINSLAGSTKILGGKNTAEISDAYPTLVTPAGFTFSIWGVIYTLLGVFIVYQALPNNKGQKYREKIGWLFVYNILINIAWLFLRQYEYLSFSVVLMFLLLINLIVINLNLDIGNSKISLSEKIAVQAPFSVYLGWISIATIANMSVFLTSIGWDGFRINQEIWAILIILVALIITILNIVTRKDLAFGLVVIWALVGIGVNQTMNISITTGVSAIVIIGFLVFTYIFNKTKTGSKTAKRQKREKVKI